MSGNPNPSGVKLESSDRLKSRLSFYQSLDVQKAAIPPRSRLYHLKPIGVGTPYVESLTGYVARLAQQHCVTVRQLILTEIAPLQRLGENKPDYRIESISDLVGIDRRRAALNGTGLMATNLVRTLEALTRRNVERKQVLNLVLQEVIQEYPPPSLEDVALRLRCRPLVLQHHFPDLSEQIKVSHAAYRKVCQQQKIQPVLEAALQESPPPSLMEITRRLGYKNSSYLYKYFSELSRSISRRYKDYVKTCGVETRNRIREEIQTIALKLHSEGQKPTQRRVTELLTKPGIMLNQYAQETLREVQRSLGYDS